MLRAARVLTATVAAEIGGAKRDCAQDRINENYLTRVRWCAAKRARDHVANERNESDARPNATVSARCSHGASIGVAPESDEAPALPQRMVLVVGVSAKTHRRRALQGLLRVKG
jgi:hypothetical protein